MSIEFPPKPEPLLDIFAASAHFDFLSRQAERAFDGLVNVHQPKRSWLGNLFKKELILEDRLADLVIALFASRSDGWKFSSEPPQAKFDDMHIIVNFPSAKELVFQIRTADQKTAYSGIKASLNKRKEIYHAAESCRNHKILSAITDEVEKQVFMISDHRGNE